MKCQMSHGNVCTSRSKELLIGMNSFGSSQRSLNIGKAQAFQYSFITAWKLRRLFFSNKGYKSFHESKVSPVVFWMNWLHWMISEKRTRRKPDHFDAWGSARITGTLWSWHWASHVTRFYIVSRNASELRQIPLPLLFWRVSPKALQGVSLLFGGLGDCRKRGKGLK